MTHITNPIRKYAAAYCEYPSRILAYSPNILVRILRIHRVSSRICSRIHCVSCVFSRILAYSRVFAAYPAYPRIRRVFSRIHRVSCVFAAYPAYSRVFTAYSSAYSRVFAAYLPRILAYSRVFSRIRRVSAYGYGYMSPEFVNNFKRQHRPPSLRLLLILYEKCS